MTETDKHQALFNDLMRMYKQGLTNYFDQCVNHNTDGEVDGARNNVEDYDALFYKKYYNQYERRKKDTVILKEMLGNSEFLTKMASGDSHDTYIMEYDTHKFNTVVETVDVNFVKEFIKDALNLFQEILENEKIDEMNEQYYQHLQDHPEEAMAERYDHLI